MDRENIDRFLGLKKQADPLARTRAKVPERQDRRDEVADEEYTPVGVNGLLAATEKLLAVNRGLDGTDDRDAQVFKRYYTPARLLAERIRGDADKTRRRMMYAVAKHKNLKAVHPFILDSYAEGMMMGNPLTAPLEEINPLHLMEQSRRVTQMGPGGIGTDQAITADMQAVRAGQFGFISPIEGPESSRAGIDVRVSWGSKIGSDGQIYQKFRDARTGKMRWMSPRDLDGKVIRLPD